METNEKNSIVVDRNTFIIGGFIFTLFVACFSTIIVLQTVLISRQNNMERLVMMVMASQFTLPIDPESQIFSDRYFSGRIDDKAVGMDNDAVKKGKRGK